MATGSFPTPYTLEMSGFVWQASSGKKLKPYKISTPARYRRRAYRKAEKKKLRDKKRSRGCIDRAQICGEILASRDVHTEMQKQWSTETLEFQVSPS